MKLITLMLLTSLSFVVLAQDRFADVTITDTPLKGSVHMLQGSGGNIGVSAGDDGILIIDDQYEPLAERIAEALGELGSDKPKYIINTHYHGDHTGSNAFFHEHKGATIFAHENVRIRLAGDEKVSESALPVVTYKDGIKLHFNNETIHVMHLPEGHTDGDSAVWFEEPDVLHTGDLFFNERFPYIDTKAGGSVTGYIQSVETLLGKADNDTVIIPGHGPLADKAAYETFLSMIKATFDIVKKHKADGMSEAEIIEAGLGEEWASWGWQFISEERWIKTLYPEA
ncbi:MBL fold metallo-hydrolase [Alteromonas halophila]|uniref:Cyclase n=1 Tax=Alteromonas halophila TaxID=516698 RepID=A0A918N054_9ALTE|nr:MBL fold metallo-hydrolase [Alteromonas halophila]GGW92053.1 cyclase [Alteromonas halophila]